MRCATVSWGGDGLLFDVFESQHAFEDVVKVVLPLADACVVV
jgi:hypothetical protein